MMVATKQDVQIAKMMEGYRADPKGYYIDVLGMKPEYIWDKMVETAESVRDHQKTLVKAGNSVSKTFNAGRIVAWFKPCFTPSTVVTTAPSGNQVKNQLWREIHAAVSGAKIPLGGKLNKLDWDLKPSPGVLGDLEPEERALWEKNFAIGFSTTADSATENATKMMGWHNWYFLFLADEGCEICPQIWNTAVEALITNERCKMLAIGNPTNPESEFAKASYSSNPDNNEGNATYISDDGWNVITIDVRETPNYLAGKEVIPGLMSRKHADGIIKKFGIDGDKTRYRVRGLFPRFTEGTYWGSKLAVARKEKRISRDFPWDSSFPVYTASDTGDWWTATIYFQLLRDRIRIIDEYYDNAGNGQPAWARALGSKPYVYGKEHFVGWEHKYGKAGRYQTGMATKDLAANLGYNIRPVAECSFEDGIEATRSIWELLDINETCQTFVQAASGYGKKKNEALSSEDKPSYHKQPKDTWHKHVMDALRHLAIQYRYGKIGGRHLGFPHAVPAGLGAEAQDFEEEEVDYLFS
jgi:hypothetical protein